MPLHLTKIAFGCDSVADLTARLQRRAEEEHGEAHLTTRYAPKRMDELVGGSLYWIHGGLIVGRSPLIGFEDNKAGRYWLKIEPRLIPVVPAPKRAHQGWRYLADADAPRGVDDESGVGELSPELYRELAELSLI